MLFAGHISMGIIFFLISRNWLLSHGGNELLLFLTLILCALLPDIDEQNSKINKWSGVIGRLVIKVFKHRGILHSLLFFGALALLTSAYIGKGYGFAVIIGYFAHIAADGITPMGIHLFYPLKFRISGPMRVGSGVETVITYVMFFAILALGFRVYF